MSEQWVWRVNLGMYALEEDIPPFAAAGSLPPLPLAQMDEEAKKEYWATLALCHCKGIGARTRSKLLKGFGSALAALENRGEWRSLGISDSCVAAAKGEAWRTPAKMEWDKAAASHSVIILWKSPYYPYLLRQLVDAPSLLYCKGDYNLLAGPAIAIVGSRQASRLGCEIAEKLAAELSKAGLTVISGMALGIDRHAHAAAIGQVGGSIGVLGTGIEVKYPASNRDLYDAMAKNGLLVSEFAPHAAPAAANFPIRNRIISGLSLGVVVVEAAIRSGSLITARQALEQNREVFAVPGAAMTDSSAGCQNLIRQGARPIFSVEDILAELETDLRAYGKGRIKNGVNPKPRLLATIPPLPEASPVEKEIVEIPELEADELAATASLAPDEMTAKVLAYLGVNGAAHIDSITQHLGIEPRRGASLLLSMEMLGQIRRLPGARYEAEKNGG